MSELQVINIGELRAYLMAEKDAGLNEGDVRVPISGDSQVCLGAVNKGRSASPALNRELEKSLPFHIGLGVQSFSGFTRTKFNPADDPTRGVPLREAELELPDWWKDACLGDFGAMDFFLEECRLSPYDIQGLPPVAELMPMAETCASSPLIQSKHQRAKSRVLEKLIKRKQVKIDPPKYDESLPWSSECHDVLMSFPRSQFFVRDESCWPPREPGFIDLFSGKKGFARASVDSGAAWVLCFELDDGADQDLMNKSVRKKIEVLLRGGAVVHFSAAPTCASFSRAITPAVRSRKYPKGLPDLKWTRPNMLQKVDEGNSFNTWIASLVEICIISGIFFWVENPDTSFFWLQPAIERLIWKYSLGSYRCDFCCYGTPWRKRTKFLANTCLQGQRDFCKGGHVHVVLRGRSSIHKCCWTKVAEPYPRRLCSKLAWAAAYELELLPRKVHRRIGEAKNPGPPQREFHRGSGDLEAVELVRPATMKLGLEQRSLFEAWVVSKLGQGTWSSCMVVPGLLAYALRAYGKQLYEDGKPLYLYRHLIIHGQRSIPALRQYSRPVWDLVTRWESLEPLKRRPPLPYALMKAMAALGLTWKWYRWTAAMMLAYFGACRPGEVLRALRRDLVLPSDLFLEDGVCYLQICKPKSGKRGLGHVQHTKVVDRDVIALCEKAFWQTARNGHALQCNPSDFPAKMGCNIESLGSSYFS